MLVRVQPREQLAGRGLRPAEPGEWTDMTGYDNYRKPPVTAREARIIALVAAGCRDQDIAAELDMSLGTVDTELRRIRARVTAINRAHLVTVT
jgi:DNA-binding CsgD family transcriptional regulator